MSTASSGRVRPAPARRRVSNSVGSGQHLVRRVDHAGLRSATSGPARTRPDDRRSTDAPGSAARTGASCGRARLSTTSSVPACRTASRSVGSSSAGFDRQAEEDLEVHLLVGGVDAGRVVDGVHVDPTAAPGVLDAGPLGERQVRALGDDPGPQASTPRPAARRWPDRRCRRSSSVLARTNVPTPPAKSRSTGARRTARITRRASTRSSWTRSSAWACGDRSTRFAARDQTPPPALSSDAVVVLPTRSAGRSNRRRRSANERPGRGRGRGRCGGGRTPRRAAGSVAAEHAVAEHVTRHVADADDRDRLVLHVDAELGEVVADRLPGALGR